MGENQGEQVRCQICRQMKDLDEVWPGELIREGVIGTIRKKYPEWDDKGYICQADLNHFRGNMWKTSWKRRWGRFPISMRRCWKA